LEELGRRNAGIEGLFKRIDANTITAHIYKSGKKISECAVRQGGLWREGGITFSWDALGQNNSCNEMLSLEVDDQAIYFRTLGMTSKGAQSKLSHEGAAECFWALLIERLQ
jgi:hypothetical protein